MKLNSAVRISLVTLMLLGAFIGGWRTLSRVADPFTPSGVIAYLLRVPHFRCATLRL